MDGISKDRHCLRSDFNDCGEFEEQVAAACSQTHAKNEKKFPLPRIASQPYPLLDILRISCPEQRHP